MQSSEQKAWFAERQKARRASGSILDYVRIIEPNAEKIRNLCSPGWIYSPSKGTMHRMNCKRRTCEDCGWFWAWRWRQALKEKAINDNQLKKPKADKALTLTFAENIPYRTMHQILRQFFKLLRRAYPKTEYWGAVEFNQTHTLPHLHFILSGTPYLEIDYLDYCFKVAQKRYKVEHLAWNLRIEKIKKNIQAYFTKYVTKLLGGKDEIPRRENWGGRFVRYSRGFFPVPVNAMLAGVKFQEKLKANDQLDRVFWHVRKPHAGLFEFKMVSRETDRQLNELVTKDWSFAADRARAAPVEPDNLFTGVDTILVSFNPVFDGEFYKKLESYNFTCRAGRYGPAF